MRRSESIVDVDDTCTEDEVTSVYVPNDSKTENSRSKDNEYKYN